MLQLALSANGRPARRLSDDRVVRSMQDNSSSIAGLIQQLDNYRQSTDGTMQRLAASAAIDVVPGEAPLVLSMPGAATIQVQRSPGDEESLAVASASVVAGVDATGALPLLEATGQADATDVRIVQWQVSPQAPSDQLVSASEREQRPA